MEENDQFDQSLCALIEIIHFTEQLSAKIHGILDQPEIFRIITEEFIKSQQYTASILLLTEDRTQLRIASTSILPQKSRQAEKLAQVRLEDYRIDLYQSGICHQVVADGRTVQAKVTDILEQLFPLPLARRLSTSLELDNKHCILTPLHRYGSIIGVFAMSSTDLTDFLIPSVRNFVQHISAALELAAENYERQEAEKKLRKSEEKWRSLVKNAPNIIMSVDLDGTIEFINRTVSGIREADAIGSQVYDYIESEYHNVVRESIEYVFQTGEVSSYVIKGTGPNGRISWYETQLGPISYEGQVVAVTLITSDVTDRVRLENAWRESEERLRSFINSATDNLTLWDSELNLVEINNRALELFPAGTKKEDLIGKQMLELAPDLKKIGRYDKYVEVIKTGKPFFIDDYIPDIGKGEIHLSLRAFKVGDGMGMISTDITERKSFEKQMLQQEKLAAIGRVSAGVAHEINNPLDILLSKIESIQMNGIHSDELPGHLNEMKEQVLRISRITQALLSHTKDSALDFVPLDIHAVLEGVLFVYRCLQSKKNVFIETHLSPEMPQIMGDKFELEKVFTNIMNNAMDAIPQTGTIIITSKLAQDDWIQVEFSDSGVGIQEEHLDKIFEPFFTTKEPLKGTGLGLFLCRKIINGHQGSIQVKSQVGEGTTIIITLPSEKIFRRV